MKTTLLIEQPVPDFDAQIVQFVHDSGEDALIGGKEMIVGIEHNGKTYRHIMCDGLHEYLSCVGFLLEELHLSDLLADKPAENGVDSLFVQQ